MHQAHRRFEAVLELLSAGAVIEQVSDAPLTYTLKVGREAVPIDGGLVQQLRKRPAIPVLDGRRGP